MRWGRRLPEEAKTRGHALDTLRSGRCREGYSGASEAGGRNNMQALGTIGEVVVGTAAGGAPCDPG
jgi:hypothetical protein